MKHRLVSAPTLAKASLELNLGEFLRFGRGEEKSGGRQKNALLADVFEAITGAIFLDGGLEAATRFVCYALRDELEGADPLSAAQGRLQNHASGAAAGRAPPRAALFSNRNPRPAPSTYFPRRSLMGRRQHPRGRALHQDSGSRRRESRARGNELA